MKKTILIILTSSFIVNAFSIKLKSKDIFENKTKSKKPVIKIVIKEDEERSNGILTSPFIIPAKFYGEIIKDESGDYSFYIEKLKYITSWANGWTHGEHEASGIINFKQVENGYKAVIKEDIEIWGILKGEIRYFDDYYRGNKGLQKVRNRITRIRALVEFIKNTSRFPNYFGKVWIKTNYGSAFNKSVKKFLLDKKTKYTEDLIGLYDSGTVRRDLEEAVELFFMEYNRHYFFTDILNESLFEID